MLSEASGDYTYCWTVIKLFVVMALDENRIAHAAKLVTVKYGIPGLKHAMDLNGYYGGPPRLPLSAPSAEAKREIEEAFRDLKG